MSVPTTAAYALTLDAADPLARFRERFVFADPNHIYLDGNSLGRLPSVTPAINRDVVERQWGEELIRSWSEGWFDAPERIGAKIAQLVGARPTEVLVADATSVNLFKLVVGALRARPARRRILTDNLNFPSDLYVLQGAMDLLDRGHQLDVVSSHDGIHGPADALVEALDEDVALVTLSHTVFKSGYTYDMESITRIAHEAGALVLWDLSHAAGALPVELNRANVDLAVGCTYKYLNGGPGAPAFLYLREDLQEKLTNPIQGWMGQHTPFDFGLTYAPAPGIRRFASGTPPIVSMSLIEPGIDLLLEAGIDALRAKSMRQTTYLIDLWEQLLQPLGYSLNSPRDPSVRGSHVSIGHAEALRIDLALIHEMNVLPDFRYPDNIRLGIASLYTSFSDIHTAVIQMRRVVEEQIYLKYPDEKPVIT